MLFFGIILYNAKNMMDQMLTTEHIHGYKLSFQKKKKKKKKHKKNTVLIRHSELSFRLLDSDWLVCRYDATVQMGWSSTVMFDRHLLRSTQLSKCHHKKKKP